MGTDTRRAWKIRRRPLIPLILNLLKDGYAARKGTETDAGAGLETRRRPLIPLILNLLKDEYVAGKRMETDTGRGFQPAPILRFCYNGC